MEIYSVEVSNCVTMNVQSISSLIYGKKSLIMISSKAYAPNLKTFNMEWVFVNFKETCMCTLIISFLISFQRNMYVYFNYQLLKLL